RRGPRPAPKVERTRRLGDPLMTKPKRLYCDIETRSRVDLKKSNVYRYVEDPDFAILLAAYAIDDGPIILASTPEEIAAIPYLRDPSVEKVAHNAAFERVCFSAYYGLPVGTYL